VSEAAILASWEKDEEIENRFRKVPPERFEQGIERTVVEGVNAV